MKLRHEDVTLCAGGVVADSLASFRRRVERGSHRVSNQSGTLSADSLHAIIVCASGISGEGVPRTMHGSRDHELLFRPEQHDGQMRPASREVHGVLLDVPGRRRPEGRQPGCGFHQDQAHNPVRRLVPHGIQVRHQLPTSHCRPRRRSSQGN